MTQLWHNSVGDFAFDEAALRDVMDVGVGSSNGAGGSTGGGGMGDVIGLGVEGGILWNQLG